MKERGPLRLALAVVGLVVVAAVVVSGGRSVASAVLGGGWASYLATAGLGVVGLTLLGVRVRRAPASPAKTHADLQGLQDRLKTLVGALQDINTNSEAIGIDDLRRLIDDRLADDLWVVASERDRLRANGNARSYSTLLDRLDVGVLQVERARSASDTGDTDTMWASMADAEERLTEAWNLLHLPKF